MRPGISVGREKRVNPFRRGSALQIGERVLDLSVAIGLTWFMFPALWLLGVLLGVHLICEDTALGYLAWQVRQS